MEFVHDLNPEQKAAVEHEDGPMLILAGAGSGKTRVLIHRITRLLEKGVQPERILAITFTNKAASEMRSRAVDMVGPQASRMWIATFHAVCVRILREEISVLGYKPNFTIVDQDDAERMLKAIVRGLNLDDKIYKPSAVGEVIDRAKNKMIGPDAFARQAYDPFGERVAQIYREYQQRLFATNCLDFNDLINLAVRLFEAHPDILARYQERFRYIMIDEYQDTNHSQYRLVSMLAASHHNLCVVGDEDQGIYSWRGADISNILNFEKDYPDAIVVKLEQNYRSTQPILDVAWHVISNNRSRKEKRLWSARESEELVVLQALDDEHAEAQAVVIEIERLRLERRLQYGDFAILYRMHSQSRVFEEKMLQRQIPYTIYGGTRFFERREIKDILAYLRIVANPYDDQSLLRIINVPRRGIGDTTLSNMSEFAREAQIPWYAMLEMAEEIPQLARRTVERLKSLWEMLEVWRKQVEFLNITELTEQILAQSGYLDSLKESLKEEDQDRLENIEELLNVTYEYDRDPEAGHTLDEFLANVSLLSSTDVNAPDSSDRVMMMSLHSAKGLEFPVVFLAGMEEGVFPHSRSLEDEEELEEERRLCYVGMTRAKDLLYLSYAYGRTFYGRTTNNQPSRFIGEIPKELLYDRKQPSREKALKATTWSTSPAPSLYYGVPEQTAPNVQMQRMVGHLIIDIREGDRVWHRNWEDGVVLSIRGEGEDTLAEVEFSGVGVKLLMLKYAGLEKMDK